ncbi:MAG TPA: putative manganese transporter, partial [Bacillota bacterium]|nr:putative manganese transporter [Bacillota bacterium]
HEEGDAIDLALHHKAAGHLPEECLPCRITHGGFWVRWVFIAVGLVLGIMDIMQFDVNALAIPNLGMIVGVGGTTLAIVFMALAHKFLSSDTHEETEQKMMSLRETFIHNAQETAFVIVWVFVGFLVYEFLVLALGRGDYAAGELLIESVLMSVGLASVFIGALVGMIPGCGPQILFVALYGRGLVPFAALFANAISQDGDALFPLLALDRRSALWATMITTVPALLFGLLVYWAEINTVLGKVFNF